jgi:NDP-sugar pyrophosphorylase family protein
MKFDTAVLLAGGLGTRLYPYTATIPKPLVKVGCYPIMEILIRQLLHYGFHNIVVAVNHRASQIESYFSTGSSYGVNLSYVRENKRLGTMGPLTKIKELPEHFLVVNGDILTDLDFRKLAESHVNSATNITVGAYRVKHKIAYGVIHSDDNQKIVDFEEKPSIDVDVSMGICAMNQVVCESIPKNQYYGFDDLVFSLLEKGDEINTFYHMGYWRDLGTPDEYQKANEEFGQKEKILLCD